MASYTPGPWSIAPAPDDAEVLDIVSDYSELPGGRKAAHWIAELDAGGIDDNRDQMRENARLIAAAPDLLVACKLALDLMERFQQTHDTFDGRVEDGESPFYMDIADTGLSAPLSKVLENAIAKAEGR